MVQLSQLYMTTGKTIALTIQTFVGKVLSLLFNYLSRFVIAFLPRNSCHLISWLQSLSVVILETKKIKSVTVSTFSIFWPWSDRTRCHDLSFLNVEFEASFFTLLFHTHQKALSVPLHFLPLERYLLHIWGFLYFSQQSWFQLVIHPAQYFTCCTQYIN